MKLSIPLRATIPHLVSKNYVPRHNRPAVSDVRVTSCSADFEQKVFYGHFLRSLRKCDIKVWIAALNPEYFGLTFFNWWPEMTLTCIMVTKHRKYYLKNVSIHTDSLALFALNIEIMLADTKPEKSNILTLTWPLTSSVTSRSSFTPCSESSRQGYRMTFEFWKSVQ